MPDWTKPQPVDPEQDKLFKDLLGRIVTPADPNRFVNHPISHPNPFKHGPSDTDTANDEVYFDNEMEPRFALLKREAHVEKFVEGLVHLYAPVEKKRVCVWTRNEDRVWFPKCLPHGDPDNKPEKFCPHCGGKVKVKL